MTKSTFSAFHENHSSLRMSMIGKCCVYPLQGAQFLFGESKRTKVSSTKVCAVGFSVVGDLICYSIFAPSLSPKNCHKLYAAP